MLSFKIPPVSAYVTLEEYSCVTCSLVGTTRQYLSEGRVIIKPKGKLECPRAHRQICPIGDVFLL